MKDTRKTQALAEQRRQFEAQMAQNVQPNPQGQAAPQQSQPQSPEINPKEYYENLSKYAMERVAKNLGEEFDEYNPVHQTALADEISTIKAATYERNVAQQQLQSIYDKYKQDPNIQAIDRYAAQRLEQLPYAQAIQVQEALKNFNAPVIDAYMASCRDEFYRGRGYIPEAEYQIQQVKKTVPQNSKVKPPYVENTGAAQNPVPNGATKLDYSKLGSLSMEDQAKLASRFGLG